MVPRQPYLLRDAGGREGCEDARGRDYAFVKKSLAKNFPERFLLRKYSSLNKVLSVYNKTAYFNEKNRRTASPPTVFVVFESRSLR